MLLQAVTAYMDVVRDQELVRLRENNVNVLSRELKATQDRFAVGEVTRTDVAQAQARRAGAVSALDLARANLKTSRAAYQQVVGHPPTMRGPAPPEKFLPQSLDEAISIGNNENPLVIGALYREQAASTRSTGSAASCCPRSSSRRTTTTASAPRKRHRRDGDELGDAAA